MKKENRNIIIILTVVLFLISIDLLAKEPILVAIIDTGIDSKHTELQNSLWQNPGESGVDKNGKLKSQNGIDDDGNGFVDDLHGWNFAEGNNRLKDNHGHGTHIAGIISRGQTYSKRMPSSERFRKKNVKLMILKYFNPKASGEKNLRTTIQAIYYAIKMKANIINYSGGGSLKSYKEKEAIRLAEKKGILFVAAAGNEGINSDYIGYYPAGYKLSNILSVGAIDQGKKILSFSNYGQRSVDIAAHGENIFSTLNGGSFGMMTGTSQATALVTRAASLLMSKNSYLKKPERVIQSLVSSGDLSEGLRKKIKHQTSLNTRRALSMKGKGVSASGDYAENIRLEHLQYFTLDEDGGR